MENRTATITTESTENGIKIVSYLYEGSKLISKLSEETMTTEEILSLTERFKEGTYTPNLLNG